MIPSPTFEKSISRFLKPIQQFLDDDTVSEIMINGPYSIWVERKGILTLTDAKFPSQQSLDSALTNISQYCGRPYNIENPILETHLPDGSRLEAVMAPIAQNGTAVAIRRFSKNRITIDALINFGALTHEVVDFLAYATSKKKNIVVSGGTGSGKTSLLCALGEFLSEGERIVVIEDTHEIELPLPHVVYLESRSEDERGKGRITIRNLLSATLRLRPDRIFIGEIRGDEAIDLVAAMTSGHAGSMTTVHANTPYDALGRFENMILCNDSAIPHLAVRNQLASAIDIVLQVSRRNDGSRGLTEIAAVETKLEQSQYVLKTIFKRDDDNNLNRISSYEKWGLS
jgi:pilus assembly protein CpaF